jgi:uridine phosphorylase
VVADKAAYISRNVDHFIAPTSTSTPYHISNLVAPDPSLTNLLYDKLGETMMVNKGINLSADSFYGSQGRIDPGFVDENSKLIGDVKERYVDAMTLEMESFYVSRVILSNYAQLIHLAKCCKSDIRIACCAMVFAQRESNEFLAPSVISDLEMNGGRILLDVITQYTF